EAAVFGDDGEKRGVRRLGLAVGGGVGGSFEDNFERPRLLLRRRGKHALEAVVKNAIPRGKTVDQIAAVARQKPLGGAQCRRQQLLVEQPVVGVAVEALAGVIRVQGDDAVERLGAQLLLEDAHLRLLRTAPEFAVEIDAEAVGAGAVLITGGIADRVADKIVVARQLRMAGQSLQQLQQRLRPGRLVTVHQRENTDAFLRRGSLRPEKSETRNGVAAILVPFER